MIKRRTAEKRAMTQWSRGSSWNKLVPSPFSTKLERVGGLSILWENTAPNISAKFSYGQKRRGKQELVLDRKVLCQELGWHGELGRGLE